MEFSARFAPVVFSFCFFFSFSFFNFLRMLEIFTYHLCDKLEIFTYHTEMKVYCSRFLACVIIALPLICLMKEIQNR